MGSKDASGDLFTFSGAIIAPGAYFAASHNQNEVMLTRILFLVLLNPTMWRASEEITLGWSTMADNVSLLMLIMLYSNDNLNAVTSNVSTVIDLLEDKGISWAEYQEDMVSCFTFPIA